MHWHTCRCHRLHKKRPTSISCILGKRGSNTGNFIMHEAWKCRSKVSHYLTNMCIKDRKISFSLNYQKISRTSTNVSCPTMFCQGCHVHQKKKKKTFGKSLCQSLRGNRFFVVASLVCQGKPAVTFGLNTEPWIQKQALGMCYVDYRISGIAHNKIGINTLFQITLRFFLIWMYPVPIDSGNSSGATKRPSLSVITCDNQFSCSRHCSACSRCESPVPG